MGKGACDALSEVVECDREEVLVQKEGIDGR
jgi:hypothetical protein